MKSVCSLRDDEDKSDEGSLVSVFVAGAISGFVNTSCIYPLDTIKTRLQSASGFKPSGGFKGIYRGFRVLAVGAVLINGVFFFSYETIKQTLEPHVHPSYAPWVHMFTASISRVLSCLIRVPVEIVKQRQQVGGKYGMSAISIWTKAYKTEGVRFGLYRGFASTCIRDIPFSFIEMPIWEVLKASLRTYTNNSKLSSVESAACGVVAGGVAGALTTPFDVVKTRIILEDLGGKASDADLRIRVIFRKIYAESGVKGLFAGVMPRVTMQMVGGFIFYTVYEEAKDVINNNLLRKSEKKKAD